MFCPNCGKAIQTDWKFCMSCGAPISTENNETTDAVEPRREEFNGVDRVQLSTSFAEYYVVTDTSFPEGKVVVTVKGNQKGVAAFQITQFLDSIKLKGEIPGVGMISLEDPHNISYGPNQLAIDGINLDMNKKLNVTVTINPFVNIIVNGTLLDSHISDIRSQLCCYSSIGNVDAGTVNLLDVEQLWVGNISVQNVLFDVSVMTPGSGDVSINGGTIRNLNATLTGSGNLFANAVSGNVQVYTSGAGDITINSGETKSFTGSTHGAGNITHHGTVTQYLNVLSTGAGDININHCLVRPTQARSTGAGDIYIGH